MSLEWGFYRGIGQKPGERYRCALPTIVWKNTLAVCGTLYVNFGAEKRPRTKLVRRID